MQDALVAKYNIPGPRYTSYPTVPYWDTDTFMPKGWEGSIQKIQTKNNASGISLYIHLPFCESMCTFCGCHKHITRRHSVEHPYIQAVLKEWELYSAILPKPILIKEIHLGGGTPTFFSPENLQFLINGIFKYAKRATDYAFSFEGHPNNTTKAHLKALYAVGFTRVSFGVQDYDPVVQKAINRVQSFAQVKKVTQQARAIGYQSISHDLVYGLPFQTQESLADTILKTKALSPDRIALYSYAHVPWIKGNGQRGFQEKDLPVAQQKSNFYNQAKKQFLAMGYVEIGMDHFALPTDTLTIAMRQGKLHRNFMGYTSSKTDLLLGLGVSSISDSWYGFAQNTKRLPEYYRSLEQGVLPVVKGHLLSQEDVIVRTHILNLMCQFKTSWQDTDLWFTSLPDVITRLLDLQEDGLVVLKDHTLEVTQKGKPFVRVICMAFDLRLQADKPTTSLFSMAV